MIGGVSAEEKVAISAHLGSQLSALASDAALYGPALGHPMDPRTPDDDTANSLRFIVDDALEALYRASDALSAAQSPEAMQRVIDKLHSIGKDLGNADWE